MPWTIALQLNLVADGGPFSIKTGQLLEWHALAFSSNSLSFSQSRHKSAKETKLGVYSVDAEVIFVDENAIVLDCGIPAVGDPKYISLPQDLKTGQFVTGEICFDVPLCTAPFPDGLAELVEVNMRVERILADTTPDIVQVDGTGCVTRIPYSSRQSYEEVVSDVPNISRYLLICELGSQNHVSNPSQAS